MTNAAEFASHAPRAGEPFVSVVVPARDAAAHLPRCLDALSKSDYARFEIVVVDDASSDATANVALARGCKVLSLATQAGPAAARNRGAREARGDVLLFIDADVEVHADTIARAAAHFTTPRAATANASGSNVGASNVGALNLDEGERVAAVFGSYDDAPAETNFASQFKNLFHRHTHQRSSPLASTFWAGCGAIRREVFEAVGGFDARRYRRPSVEDIELGYRLRRAGFRVALDPELQAKHLKRWTLASLVRADVRDRAAPWSRLILEGEGMIDELNLRVASRASVALVLLAASLLALVMLMLAASLFSTALPAAWPFTLSLSALAAVVTVVIVNRDLYVYFLRLRGARFAAASCAMHLFYFLYSGATFALCAAGHALRRRGGAALGATVKDARRAG